MQIIIGVKMNEEMKKKIYSLADLMPTIPDPSAEIQYEFSCGAIVWSDENPPLNIVMYNSMILKSLIWYRTQIILKQNVDNEEVIEIWNIAKEAFPKWIGFSVDRLPEMAAHVEQFMAELKDYNKEFF
jgi:hypothetical protein